MYRLAFFAILWTAECANYQRYGVSSTLGPYSTYSTISNLYNQNPPKSTYGSDIANFPEATRYPNYNQGYTTSNYNSYSSTSGLYNGAGYNTQRYGQNYGQNYGSNYGQNYGSNYGQKNGGYSSYEIPFMTGIRDYCINRSPQVGIWVDSLMGMWYGVEFIQHLAGDARVDYARSCIVVHISEPMDQPSTENQHFHVQHINAKFRQEYRHLRLLWDEAGQTTEYGLYFRNDSAGYWQVFDGQNGTLTTLPNYQQFSGSIQVLKAVSGHLVLNFCQEPKNGRPAQLYSVLFSRDPGTMARWEVDSIHSMLQNKKLSVASRRMVCGNNAFRTVHSLFLCFIIFMIGKVTSS